ncbi:MAG: AGE family epimerase/isomerase [Propionivibrio sp.]|nr:AGE family epimerase/isomerase [Propionivibrio sp.]
MTNNIFRAFKHAFLRCSSVLCVALLLSGCDIVTGNNHNLAIQWHRHDLDTQVARWLAVSPTPSGLLLGKFDRQWHSASPQTGDLTSHSRIIFAMIIGHEITGDKRYLEVALRGTDFLLSRFHDSQHGGFYNHVGIDGQVINAAKNTYGHAFALLALSQMARVTREEKFRIAALNAWHDIDTHLRDADGGFRPEAPPDFGPSSSLRNQNPVMHMFEALLALVDATGDPQALAGAVSVGNFVVNKLLEKQPDGGARIPEWYDERWKPLPTKDKGGYIDIGHQFEWSHLLAGAEHRGLSASYAPAADALLKYSLKAGYDEYDGGAFNRVYPDGSVDRDKYWWQQAECLRALMVAAAASNRRDLWRRYEQTVELVKEQFIDDSQGGWKIATKRTCDAGHCSNEQPDPYHMVGMHAVALNLSKADR